MPVTIQPFDEARAGAVRDFNRRLAAAGSTWQFPESPVPSWLARTDGSPVFQEFFVAAEGDVVRGAYALQHRRARLGDEDLAIGAWFLPISEGTIDSRHALVATLLLRDALRREPLSFGLGMNGMDSQLGRLAGAMRCERRLVPFFVRIEHGRRFVLGASFVRQSKLMAAALDLAAGSGMAHLGAQLVKRALRRGPGLGDATAETVPGFGRWADELWERCRGHYSFVGARDAATLERIYPDRPGYQRLRIVRRGQDIGWAVIQFAHMKDNRHFGSLYVGRITDAFAAPEDAGIVMRAAADALAARGVDVMVSNQLHPAWCAALRRNAFIDGSSNYVFAPTAPLADRIRAIDPDYRRVHVNRGDGDGPWGHDPRSF